MKMKHAADSNSSLDSNEIRESHPSSSMARNASSRRRSAPRGGEEGDIESRMPA